MSDEDHPAPAEGVHDSYQIFGKVPSLVGGGLGPLALPVSPLIQGDDVKPIGEGGRHGVKPVGVGPAAVKKEEARVPRLPPLEAMKAQGVEGQDATPC